MMGEESENMGDDDEDTPPAVTSSPAAETADVDPTDEVQDFQFLISGGKTLPARGVKDFEPHGTNLQHTTIEKSREAMRIVLSHTRHHNAKTYQRAVWDEKGNGAWCFHEKGVWINTVGVSRRVSAPRWPVGDNEKRTEGKTENIKDEENRRNEDERVTMSGMTGESTQENDIATGKNTKKGKLTRLWLMPEEALWLLEKGALDIRWPSDSDRDDDDGLPMSVQSAYATFIGLEKEGGLTLEQFKVFQYLKRAGFTVLRARDNLHNIPRPAASIQYSGDQRWTLFTHLWGGVFARTTPGLNERAITGPLVPLGMYRSFDDIYRMVLFIPFHRPSMHQSLSPPDCSPGALSMTYHVYRASPKYKKTAPGPPDFYICVLDARATCLPTEPQLDGLLKQTPYHPPINGDPLYRNVKNGYRNVLLAVVDQGVSSFLNISDCGFGCEKIWGRVRRVGGGGSAKRDGIGSGRGRGTGRDR